MAKKKTKKTKSLKKAKAFKHTRTLAVPTTYTYD